ncbi:helix-turn-helix transcriptional regulator [Saliphagus infecundisoli]|uniref:Helix-turn-helix transcriptional regulator n=2 Tax=Saliphagus infecundisoli TaxID=1849069 RepID=A0ABD5QLE8_9EURY|nr:HTH domain-containing protein [Saliphagus infecundisoli]
MQESKQKLAEMPPSSKLVYIVLQHEEALTQKKLAEETRLSKRTIRYALQQLESTGLVEEDIYIRDARQNLYRLSESNCTACG